ncbi:MAG: Lar family restriction alleviation protein [Candidatus Gastranaerophilales bacterium]|nr:Lar family restriction alleviation protein [Candidatus Gastranaerophilales bacterium]
MEESLKPCPFCGKDRVGVDAAHSGNYLKIAVQCYGCGAKTSTAWVPLDGHIDLIGVINENVHNVTGLWNRRDG